MFELSLVELLLIGVVALFVIGPEDMPKAISALVRLFRQVQDIGSDIRQAVRTLAQESGVDDLKADLRNETRFIRDQNGQWQEIFDISELIETEKQADAQHQLTAPAAETSAEPRHE